MNFSKIQPRISTFVFAAVLLFCSSHTAFSEGSSGGLLGFLGSSAGSSADDAPGQELLGFFGSALGRATDYAKSKFDWTRQLVPFANFIFFLPQNLMRSLQDNDYTDRKFVIENKSADGDEQKNYGIEMDMGFEGSGDVNQPFGFVLHDGRFYFRSTKVRFIPEKFYLKNEDGTVKEAKRTDIREYPFSVLIPTLLRQFFQEKGLEAWNLIRRFMSPYPQDVAMIKIISLVAAAFENSKTGKGYPRVAHVPLELSILFSRLAKTPDISATQRQHAAGTKSNQWDPSKIVFMDGGPSEFIEGLPGVLKESINQIQFPVYEGELQEFKDMQGKGLTEAQELYGDMRTIVNYNVRTEFALDRILPFVDQTDDLTATDASLLMYAIKIHALERLDSLNSYILARVSAVSDFAGELIETSGHLSDTSLDSARSQLADMDSEGLREILEPQYEGLQNLLKEAQRVFSKRAVRSSDVNFLADQITGMDGEIDRLVFAVEQLGKAVVAGGDDDFRAAYKDLMVEIDELMTIKAETSKSVATGQKISLPLIEYLGLRYFQFEQLNYKKFDGDAGYFKDDSSLGTIQGVNYAMAVVLRAMKDLLKAESLFKQDTEGQYMISPTGERELVRGKLIYQDYHEKPIYFKQKVEEQADDLRSQVESQASLLSSAAQNLGLEAQEGQINEKLKKAEEYYESLNATYMHYLRQFRFDRRDLSGSFAGRPFDPAALGSMVKTEEEVAKADLDASAKEWIENNKLYVGSPMVRLDAMIRRKKIEQIIDNANDPTEAMKQEGVLAEKINKIAKYEADITKMNEIRGDLDARIAQENQSAGPTPEKIVYQEQMKELVAAIERRNLEIDATQAEIRAMKDQEKEKGQEQNFYQGALADLDAIINNHGLTAEQLDVVLTGPAAPGSALYEKIKNSLITDREFLMTAARVRELVESGQAASFIAEVDGATGAASEIDTETFESILASVEKGLNIPESESLLGAKMDSSKKIAGELMNKVLKGELDFRGLELEFVQKVGSGQGPDELKNAKGFFASLARACTFALLQVYKSQPGRDYDEFLAKKVIPGLGEGSSDEQEPEQKEDSIDALIEKMSEDVSTSQSGATVADAQLDEEFGHFVSELGQAVENNDVWSATAWESNVLVKPKKLPLTPSHRMDVVFAALSNLLTAKAKELGLTDVVVKRFHAIFASAKKILNEVEKSPDATLAKIEGWCVEMAQSTDPVEMQAYEKIRSLWRWMAPAMPYIVAYARYVTEAGTRTSVNEFLAREFANLLTRAKGFSKIARLYLDPILIRSLGVDTKTLIEASEEERQTMIEQNIAVYGNQIAGLESAAIEGLEGLESDVYAEIDRLESEAVSFLEGKAYDMEELERELAQTALAVSSGDMQFMLSSGDLDSYFNEVEATGINLVEMPTVDGGGPVLESDLAPVAEQGSEADEIAALNLQASGGEVSVPTVAQPSAPVATTTSGSTSSTVRASSTEKAVATPVETTTFVPVATTR